MRKRILTRLAAAGAGGALALAAASPALALDTDVDFKQKDDLPITADDPEFRDCDDDRFSDMGDDEDGWHFVAPGGSFLGISVTFQTDPADDQATETFSGEPEDPGDFIFQSVGDDADQHADIFTPAGWILVEATAQAIGTPGHFVLSGTCDGDSTPPEKGNGEEEEDPRDEEEDPVEDPKEDEDPEELPVTGAQLGGLLVLAGGLLAAGVAMLFVRRRQNLANLLES